MLRLPTTPTSLPRATARRAWLWQRREAAALVAALEQAAQAAVVQEAMAVLEASLRRWQPLQQWHLVMCRKWRGLRRCQYARSWIHN